VKKATREVCSCGHAFASEASFCPRCGGKRPVKDSCFTSLAEMVAMVEGLQTGAAQGVFDTVKAALESAAQSAADAINANMKTLVCTAAGSDSVNGLEAVGLLRTVRLKGAAFSGHIGFHSNQQVICHLLHLVVQLALFPQGPMTNATHQVGCPFSGLLQKEAQTDPKPILERAMQTDPEPAPPPPRNYGPCVGVRIGGGYHLFHAPDESSGPGPRASSSASGRASPSPTSREKSPSAQQRPLLEEMANETVRLSAADVTTPPPCPREFLDETGQNMYSFGARSEATRHDRFRVGAYVPSAGDVEKVVGERDLRDVKKRRDGEGVVLYRVLRSEYRRDSLAQKQRTRRGSSVRTNSARAAVEQPASAEAGTALTPSTLAAVRRLRDWATSDSETSPPSLNVLSVGRPFLADW